MEKIINETTGAELEMTSMAQAFYNAGKGTPEVKRGVSSLKGTQTREAKKQPAPAAPVLKEEVKTVALPQNIFRLNRDQELVALDIDANLRNNLWQYGINMGGTVQGYSNWVYTHYGFVGELNQISRTVKANHAKVLITRGFLSMTQNGNYVLKGSRDYRGWERTVLVEGLVKPEIKDCDGNNRPLSHVGKNNDGTFNAMVILMPGERPLKLALKKAGEEFNWYMTNNKGNVVSFRWIEKTKSAPVVQPEIQPDTQVVEVVVEKTTAEAAQKAS